MTLMCRPVLRYEECHSEHGGSHCGGGGTKSSLRGHATGGLLLRQVPESPAPVSWSRGHHPAQEHVYCAPGHSAGNHISYVMEKADMGFPVCSSAYRRFSCFFLKAINEL